MYTFAFALVGFALAGTLVWGLKILVEKLDSEPEPELVPVPVPARETPRDRR